MGATFMKLGRAPTTWRIFTGRSVRTGAGCRNLGCYTENGGRRIGGRFPGPLRGGAQLRGLDAGLVRGREAEAAAPARPAGAHAARQVPGALRAGAASSHPGVARAPIRAAQEKPRRLGRAATASCRPPGRSAAGGGQAGGPRAASHRALPRQHPDLGARAAPSQLRGPEAGSGAPPRPRDQRPGRLRPDAGAYAAAEGCIRRPAGREGLPRGGGGLAAGRSIRRRAPAGGRRRPRQGEGAGRPGRRAVPHFLPGRAAPCWSDAAPLRPADRPATPDPRASAGSRVPTGGRQAVRAFRGDLPPPGGKWRVAGAGRGVRRSDYGARARAAAILEAGAARERADGAASGQRGAAAIRVAAARRHRRAAGDAQAALTFTPRKNSTTPASPSLSCTRGSYPSRARALEMSAEDSRRSPARGGWCSISRPAAEDPITCLSVAIRSISDELIPLATLTTSPGALSLVAARRFARTTSEMWTKSRVCRPSPKTMGRCPKRRRVVKRGMAAAYSLFGSCRGP